jgi:hypothetical protein
MLGCNNHIGGFYKNLVTFRGLKLPGFLLALFLLAFIIGNSSLEPLLEGLFAQIHIDLS